MNYGEYIEKNKGVTSGIYQLVDSYFNNPVLTKTENTEQYSIYMCKLHSLLSIEKRYIVAVSPIDSHPVGFVEKLIDIKWESFQTRSLNSNLKLNTHKYNVKRDKQYSIGIKQSGKDDYATYYEMDNYPVVVTLLHTSKAKKYQPSGNFVNALETFNTVITFK